MRKIFDTSLKTKSDRDNHLRELLDTNQLQRHIRSEVNHHQLATHSFSGWFTDRLSNYLFDSSNSGSYRKGDYSFYANETHYWHKKTPSSILLVDDIEEEINNNNFLREQRSNKTAYLSKLFDPNNIAEDDYKSFIKAGYCNVDINSLDIENEMIIEGMQRMQEIIKSSCKKDDLHFLKKFNGKNNLNDIALITGVTHQSVSKKLQKICKKSRKNGCQIEF